LKVTETQEIGVADTTKSVDLVIELWDRAQNVKIGTGKVDPQKVAELYAADDPSRKP
jgi:hypothetical protein